MQRSMPLVLSLVILTAAPAFAREPIFVNPNQVHSFEILPPPPADTSDATKAELAELHKIEQARSQAEVKQAVWDDENEHIFIFKDGLGENFTEEKLPLVAAFGKRVRNDEGLNDAPAKEGFHRVRPYNLDKTLQPVCKTKTKDDSYPSGHATSGYLLALTLIDMAPEKRDALLARADAYGHNRLVCGVHYASDIPASRLAAYAIHAAMAQNPLYQTEMAAARTELRAALGLPAAK